MTTLEILRAGRARIERGWCQGAFARDANGHDVLSRSPRARAWCTSGAVEFDSRPMSAGAFAAHVALCAALPADWIEDGAASWNDAPGRTQAEVLALYDAAIAAEEARNA